MTHTNIFSLAMGSLTTVNGLTPLLSTSPSRGNPTLLREIPLAEHSLHKTLTDFKLPLIEGLPTYNACKDCSTENHHPLQLSPSPEVPTSVLPLSLDGCGRESEVGDAQSFVFNKLIAQVIDYLPSHLSSTPKPRGDRRATKVTGAGTLEVVSRGPEHKRHRP